MKYFVKSVIDYNPYCPRYEEDYRMSAIHQLGIRYAIDNMKTIKRYVYKEGEDVYREYDKPIEGKTIYMISYTYYLGEDEDQK